MEQHHWYHENKGQRVGPLSEEEMIKLIKTGSLDRHSSVWKTGNPSWQHLKDSELGSHIIGPPPLTGSHVNNTIVWLLAFAPLIGYVIEWTIAYMLNEGSDYGAATDMAQMKYWFVTIALNVLLGYWDEGRISKAGADTSKFRGITWLVPVYLYQRANHLGQNQACLVVWVACYAMIVFGLV